MRTTRLLAFAALLLPVSAYAIEAPGYLFVDWRYLVFLAVYIIATVRIVTWVRRLADNRDAQKPFPLQDVSWGAAFVMLIGLIFQGAHHYEHVSQIFQWWYLGQHSSVSKGIIFFLDLEWNHFIFDGLYFFVLLGACAAFMRRWNERGHQLDQMTLGLIIATLGLQGWHAIEHTYRIVKHVRTGCEPCSGIADTAFNVPLIPLHFWFNVFAFTFPLVLFYWLRMDRMTLAFAGDLRRRIREFFRPPSIEPQRSVSSN
jgi:hypothetical protein